MKCVPDDKCLLLVEFNMKGVAFHVCASDSPAEARFHRTDGGLEASVYITHGPLAGIDSRHWRLLEKGPVFIAPFLDSASSARDSTFEFLDGGAMVVLESLA